MVRRHGSANLSPLEASVIPTTWNGATVYLIDSEPDWQSNVRADFEFYVATETGLSNRETRRPMWRTVRTSLSFKTVVDWAAASRFVAGLRAWQTEQVAVPFWPAAVRWVDRDAASITAKLKIVFAPDLSTWELFDDVEPAWPTDDALVFPVLLGRITRNDPTWLSPSVCRFAVEFEETSTSDYALTVTEQAWTDGPEPSAAWAGAAPKLLPARLHFDRPTLGSNVETERELIGYGRTPTETLHPQPNWRRGQAAFVEASAAEVARLLRFWFDHAVGQAFWVPAWSAAATLTSPVGVSDTTVAVASGHDVKAGDWLAFSDEGVDSLAKVTTAASTALTLPAAIGAQSVRCLVSHLLLCRFERPRLQVEWLTPAVAKVRLAIRGLPAEHTPATGETLGATIGKLPVSALLYEIREPVAGGEPTIHRFTSFEEDIEFDSGTYTAAPIDHGEVRHGIALDRDEVEVRFAIASGDTTHPLVRLATLRCDAPLTLTIRRVELTF